MSVSLGQLSELTSLSMYSNSLTGTLPASLGQLSKLTILYMSSNLLTGTLDNNQLSGAIPSSLCRCQEMYIYLTDNKFLCYPTCMTSSRYHVQVDENISVCDGPSYFDICILSSMSTIPDYEMQALKDLYDSTGGDNWRWKNYGVQWDFTNGNKLQCTADDYTSWQGLTCTYNSSNDLFHVTSINLRWWYYNLNGTLPDSLGQLSELNYLQLDSESLLFGSIPASLGQLSKLSYLSISYNSLTGTLPASLGQLSELTYLDISYNSLTGTLPASLGQLNQLYYFNAVNNQLHGSIPDSFGNLNKLRSLYLQYNELSGAIPSSLCKCEEISYFFLNKNKFICYPACLSSKLYYVYYIDNIPVCENEDNPVSKSMMILWIVLPILFVLLLAASIYLYYRYRYCCLSSDSPDRSSQYVDINQNNNIMDENNDHNHDVNNQALELVVIGELVSTVAGAVATDNEILNLPSASVTNIDEEDILFVDILVMDQS